MPGGGTQAVEFLDAEHAGEPLAISAGWEMELAQWPAEGLHIQEAERRGGDVTGTPGQLAFD
jgi:hypothetical protein